MNIDAGSILITGGSGLLALSWARLVSRDRNVTLALHQRPVYPSFADVCFLDLFSIDDLSRVLDTVQPSLVIHAAALTNVEMCEVDPEEARKINVVASQMVAAATSRRGVKLVGISTDQLFDGDAAMVPEDAPVKPLNVYGRTKADGETAMLAENPDALVVRTNFFGWGPSYRQSFSDWILFSLRNQRRCRLFADVFFTPILADELVRSVHDLVTLGASGIYNVVADSRLSKYDFGLSVAAKFGLDASLIDRGCLSDLPSLAARPKEMTLSNRKLTEHTGRKIGDIDHHLHLLAELERQPEVKELQAL